MFGMNWVSSFDYSLTVPVAESDAWLQRPDGRRIRFILDKAAGFWKEDKAGAIASLLLNEDGTYTHRNEQGWTEKYLANGYPLEIRNRQGIGWTFVLSAAIVSQTLIITIQHSSGRHIRLNFGFQGELTSADDPAGIVYTYTHDLEALGPGRHRLRTATSPLPNPTVTTCHYERAAQPDALTGVSYNGVRHSTFEYDSLGRATSTLHAGDVERYTFNYVCSAQNPVNPPNNPPWNNCNPRTGVCPIAPQRTEQELAQLAERQAAYEAIRAIVSQPMTTTVVTEINPLGRSTTHDIGGFYKRITDSRGQASTHCPASLSKRAYDPSGYLDRTDDFNGNRTEYGYNAKGQIETQTEAFGSANARSTTWVWDVSGNLPESMTIAGFQKTSWVWRADGRVDALTVRNLSTTGAPKQDRTTDYSYTLHPNGLTATMTVDGPLAADTLTYTYISAGDLLTVSNTLNHTITYSEYNARGQAGRVVGINGERTDFNYDDRAPPQRNHPRQSGRVHKREFVYDLASNIREVRGFIGADLHFQSFTEYDEQNRVRKRRGNATTPFAAQFLTTFKYDLNHPTARSNRHRHLPHPMRGRRHWPPNRNCLSGQRSRRLHLGRRPHDWNDSHH